MGADQGLLGRRILVVGASAGVGKATAAALTARGASVVVVGRRATETASAAAGTGAIRRIQCDVRDEAAARAMVAEAIGTLGGLDVLLYAAGVSPLARVVDTSFAAWQAVLETNVVGLALTYAAASRALEAAQGRVVALSSYSKVDPKAGLVPYAASKAAMETLLAGLRREHRTVTFSVVTLAHTEPSEFTREFDPGVARELQELWQAAGSYGYSVMKADDVAEQIAEVIAAPMVVEAVTLVGRPAAQQ